MRKKLTAIFTAAAMLCAYPTAFAESEDSGAPEAEMVEEITADDENEAVSDIGFDMADEAIEVVTDETDIAETAQESDEEIFFEPDEAEDIDELSD